MKIRKFSTADIIDKYLIISILSVYLVVPLILRIAYDHYYLSWEIWISLIISTIVSVLMILSTKTLKLEVKIIKNIPKIFSTNAIFLFLVIFCCWELFDIIKKFIFYDSSIVRDDLIYGKNEQDAIGGRNLISYIKLFTTSFMLIVYVDIFNSNRPKNKILIFLLIIILTINYYNLVLVSAFRSPFLGFIIFWTLFYNFYINEIIFTKKKIIALIFFSFLGLFWLSWAAYYRQGDLIQINQIRILHGLSGLGTAYEIQVLKEALEIGKLKFEYGLQMVYNLISWIPRLLWEEKPLTSFSFRISNELYDNVGISNWVRTYTIPGEGYLQFGILGMVLWSVFFIYFYRFSKFVIIKYPLALPFFLVPWSSFPLLVRGDLSAYVSRLFLSIIVFFVIYTILRSLKLFKKNYT